MLLFIQIILFCVLLIGAYLHEVDEITESYTIRGMTYFKYIASMFGLSSLFMLPLLNTLLGYSYNLELFYKTWWDWGYWLFKLEIGSSGNWWNVIYYLIFYPIYFLGTMHFIAYTILMLNFMVLDHLMGGKWNDSSYVLAKIKEKGEIVCNKVKQPLLDNPDFQSEMFILYCKGYIKNINILKAEWFDDEHFIDLVIKKEHLGSLIALLDSDYGIIKEKLAKQRKFVLTAVTRYWRNLQYASDALRNNREIVLAAVAQDGEALKYASNELKNDEDIVLASVTLRGSALEYASDKLKDDEEIVLAAVRNSGWALIHASKKLRDNTMFVKTALENGLPADPFGSYRRYVKDFLDSRPYMKFALKKDGADFIHCSDRLLQDQELFDIAIDNGLSNFLRRCCCDSLTRVSKPIVLWMIKNNKVSNYNYICDDVIT